MQELDNSVTYDKVSKYVAGMNAGEAWERWARVGEWLLE